MFRRNLLFVCITLLVCPAVFGQIPADGLLAYYPLDGDAIDASGSGLDGTVFGAVPTQDRFGTAAGALFFDGEGDYAVVPHTPLLNLDNVRTVAVWINKVGRVAQLANYSVLAKYQNDTFTEDGWMLLAPTDLEGVTTAIARFKEAGQTRASDARAPVTVGDWHFLVWLYQEAAQRLELYIDGELAATTDTPPLQAGGNSRALLIGAAPFNTGRLSQSSFFFGAMDDIRIYDRVLSEEEIAALFEEGLCELGPEDAVFERGRGAPAFENLIWDSCGGEGLVELRMSGGGAATVYLNGDLLALPGDFAGHATPSFSVELRQGENVLDVEVRGRPGARLEVIFRSAD